MKRILLVAAVVFLQACSTTNPGDAAGITYRLPRTDAKVTLGIDVSDCSPLKVESTLKVDAVASARDGYISVSGASLSSQVTKRALIVDVDDNYVISSVNSTSTDQSSVIAGNVIKLGATVVGAVLAAPDQRDITQVVCNTATVKNVASLKKLQSSLDALVAKADMERDPVGEQKKIDTLTTAVATAKAKLHKDVTVNIKPELIPDNKAYAVPFDDGAYRTLSELFGTAYFHPTKGQKDSSEINDDSIQLFNLVATSKVLPDPQNGLEGDKASGSNPCGQSIEVPLAKMVTLTVTASGPMIVGNQNNGKHQEKSATEVMSISQIGDNGKLCISAAFGENRVVGLKFDKFGRATEFNWTADARAANVTSALAGSASDASTIATKLKDVGLNRQKADLDQVSTENSLQLARICKNILDAGGTACPK